MPHELVDANTPASTGVLVLDAATDAAACGHKAASLAALRSHGFDIPDGFVVPAGTQPTLAQLAVALARLGDGPVAELFRHRGRPAGCIVRRPVRHAAERARRGGRAGGGGCLCPIRTKRTG